MTNAYTTVRQERFEGILSPSFELSNIPPLTRSCQKGSDAISLNSAPYAGSAIAFCDGSGIHGDADRGDLDCAEKNEMSSHLLYALSSRCLKATRSECFDAILVLFRSNS